MESKLSSLSVSKKHPSKSTLILTLILTILTTFFTTTIFLFSLPPNTFPHPFQSHAPYCDPASPLSSSSSSLRQTTTKTFGVDPSLLSMSRIGDLAWSSKLQTPEGGFLWVRYNETVKEGWGVSMLHALHCLKMLRAEVRNGWEKEEAGKSRVGGMPRSSGEAEMGDEGKMHDGKQGDKVHLKHCLAYIAEVRYISSCCQISLWYVVPSLHSTNFSLTPWEVQSLLCAADSTIEPPVREKNAAGDLTMITVDGGNYKHHCKSTDFLFQKVKESERRPFKGWEWREGDTIESVFR